jgi:NitT/TauT family transport system ATP-binding protein
MTMGENIILQGINKSFSRLKVLHEFDASITHGEITCIMGPSGVGKTTLINLLLGLIRPESGSIQGLDKKTLAAVFQEDRLCEQFDAIDNVKLAVSEKISSKLIREEFAKVDLTEYENKPVSKLSGGMKRRVAIVRAILAKADITILDEPMKGLDSELKIKVLEYLREATRGNTVIIVTHDREEALILGAKILELH